MISMILFITNLIIKFYNAFAIHKAIGKKASITKILLRGIFGIFSQNLTQLVAQIQEEDTSHDGDENNSHYTKHSKQRKHISRRHSSDITHNDNNQPEQTYFDTNHKHYNTTIRRTDKGLQLRTIESPPKKQKQPLPERKYKQDPLKIEALETITGNKITTLPQQLITPPPAYQCLGNNISFNTTQNTSPHLTPTPNAPNIQQTSTFHGTSYESPLGINKTTPYEIPQPSSTITNQPTLIPSVKLIEIQYPPPIDFTQLKLAANKMHNRSHSLDILKDDDQPHTNEVTILTLIRQIRTKYNSVLC